MFVVDTNILEYAADRSCREHATCRARLEDWSKSVLPWYLTWNIIYEFARVVSHPRVFPRPWSANNAWRFITALLASPGLSLLVHTQRHTAIAAQTLDEVVEIRGNLVHDAHTAILMREHGIRRIYTRDTDFRRFPFLEVIDPVAVSE